jgi:predicted kinase
VITASRPECIVLVGLPGAGKTTFARQRYPSHDHISKDMLPGSASKQARQDSALRRSLAAGRSVIVDNTNVSPAERAAVIAIAREFDARVVCYHVEASTREAVARNEGRTGRAKVPKVAIFTCAKRLVRPALEEGFDEIHTVRALDDGRVG